MLTLTDAEQRMATGDHGEAPRVAMRIVADTARLLGARELITIKSAHIDGAIYHGDSGTDFAEFMVAREARVSVHSTLNVGALDISGAGPPDLIRFDTHRQRMAKRMMLAFEAMGCAPTWTCAPYQAGHRPGVGEQVAWGESNAVVFCNSVLGARTNRYGDFLDIACAITGRAPATGLHLDEARRATVHVRTDGIPRSVKDSETFWPVLGAWLGRELGNAVAVVDGLEGVANEDRLKAMGAASAAFGEVALFHLVGVTPEAPTLQAALKDCPAEQTIELDIAQLREARRWLTTAGASEVTAVAMGSPHLSLDECQQVLALLDGRKTTLPLYLNTGRHAIEGLQAAGHLEPLRDAGVVFVVDTCVVVAPILDPGGGVLLTNSGKFACYAPANTGFETRYGNMRECVETAVSGAFVADASSGW